jgi:hypothetical protein
MLRRLTPAVVLVAMLALPAGASAQTSTFGSSLSQDPNLGPASDCATKPTIQDSSGNYFPVASGQADCTWYQAGVYLGAGDPTGLVPGNGTVTSVAVRSGPGPVSPLRFVVLRTFASGGASACCFFVRESGLVQPTAGTTQSFPVSLPVENNLNPFNGLRTQDYIGISGVSGAGALPLFSNGQNNVLTNYTTGNPVSGFFYPRLGAIPNDNGGGRPGESIPGVVVTIRSTWTAGGAGTPAVLPPLSDFLTGAAFVRNGRAVIPLECLLSVECRGTLALLTGGARSAGKKAKPGRLIGAASVQIPAGAKQKVKVKLNKTGRRITRGRGAVPITAVLDLGAAGKVEGSLKLRPAKSGRKGRKRSSSSR